MADTPDPNAVERAVEATDLSVAINQAKYAITVAKREGNDGLWIGVKDARLLADAAARAAELERELAEVRDEVACVREEMDIRVDGARTERDAALARVGEVERELAQMKERYDVLHDARHAEARKADAAIARAEELSADLHEMREAAEFRAEMVQMHCDAARQYAAERDQLRAELANHKRDAELVDRVSAETVDQLRAERDRLGQCAEEWKAEAKHYADRLAAAEGALRPFAELKGTWTRLTTSHEDGKGSVTPGMIRAARAALAPSTGEPFTRGFGALPPEDEQ